MMDFLRRLHVYLIRAWLTRQIAVCKYRREELLAIMRAELAAVDADEHSLNARLRELQSDELHSRLVAVKS